MLKDIIGPTAATILATVGAYTGGVVIAIATIDGIERVSRGIELRRIARHRAKRGGVESDVIDGEWIDVTVR